MPTGRGVTGYFADQPRRKTPLRRTQQQKTRDCEQHAPVHRGRILVKTCWAFKVKAEEAGGKRFVAMWQSGAYEWKVGIHAAGCGQV